MTWGRIDPAPGRPGPDRLQCTVAAPPSRCAIDVCRPSALEVGPHEGDAGRYPYAFAVVRLPARPLVVPEHPYGYNSLWRIMSC